MSRNYKVVLTGLPGLTDAEKARRLAAAFEALLSLGEASSNETAQGESLPTPPSAERDTAPPVMGKRLDIAA